MLESDAFKNAKSKLTVGLGKDIGGNVVIGDIAKMPHVLIAGQTGSGKSVCVNSIIMSILYKSSPEEVKLIMIDLKLLNLAFTTVYRICLCLLLQSLKRRQVHLIGR